MLPLLIKKLIRRTTFAKPWLWRLVSGLQHQRPEIFPIRVHVGFAVDKAALGKVSLRVLQFSPLLQTHSFTWHRRCILATDIVVKHPDSIINNKLKKLQCRSRWPRGLRRRSTAVRLLRSWVRIPPEAQMSVCCECCVLSGRGLCDKLITRPEESYRLRYVVVYDLEKQTS